MQKVIYTRSPFFVQLYTVEALVTCTIKVWSGDRLLAIPTEDSYVLTKIPRSNSATFEIAELLRDYLAHTSSLNSGYAWAKVTLSDGVSSTVTEDFFVTEGYTTYDKGLQSPSSIIAIDLPMITSKTVYVAQGKTVSIPVYTNGDADFYRYELFTDGVSGGSVNFTYSDDSNSQVKYITVPDSVQRVDIYFRDLLYSIKVVALDCSKYKPILLTYVNRYGVKAMQWFTLLHNETISTSSDNFQRSLVNYGSMTAGNQLHSFRKRITGSKQMYEINADHIEEVDVSSFEELFLSEYVWLSMEGQNATPVNVKESTFEKKKHVNTGLIRYSMKLETASNYLNTVR